MRTGAGLSGRGIVVLAVVLTVAAAGILVSSSYVFRPTRSFPTINLSYSATIDRGSPAYYATGEVIRVEFNVTDYKIANLTISSSTQCVFGFRVTAGDTEGPAVYDSSKHVSCGGPQFRVTLTPGKSFITSLAWNQLDDHGNQAPPGRYEIMGHFSGSNTSGISNGELVAGAVYFGTPLPVSAQYFLENYYISLSTDSATYSSGKPVRVDEGIVNNGKGIDSFGSSPCSFSYQIFNLTNSLVFDSLRHGQCLGSPEVSVVVPQGGLFRSEYWNQTDDPGRVVPQGVYHIVDRTNLLSGGHEINATKRWDVLVGSGLPSDEQVVILSSSICSPGCTSNSTNSSGGLGKPSLSVALRVTGTLRTLQLYLNGVSITTRNYVNQCCAGSTDLALNIALDNTTVPIFRGGAYDIVVVAAFQDGRTSLSWADPLVPWGGVP